MKKFYHEVDFTSRQAMVDFLTNHFRYYTANSWNGSTSYACNLKLWHLGLPADISDKLFEMLYTDDFAIERSELIHQFDEAHNYKWQAARNGGYLVLYQGDLVPTEHKSYCPACGQRNFTTVEETGKKCGRCRKDTRINFAKPPMQAITYPGRGTDVGEDFEGFTMEELQERVKLVQELDQLADDIVEAGVYLAENCEIIEEEYTVVKFRKVLKSKEMH